MAKPEKLIPIILKWEGGWSNHPADRGGATMCGITYQTFCAWRKQRNLSQPTVADLQHISQTEWADIFTNLYWNKWKASLIHNQSIANILVDFAWASGVATSVRYIQRHVLALVADGIVGPITLCAINNHPNPRFLFEQIKQARLRFVEALAERDPTQKVFLRGWKNRIESFGYES